MYFCVNIFINLLLLTVNIFIIIRIICIILKIYLYFGKYIYILVNIFIIYVWCLRNFEYFFFHKIISILDKGYGYKIVNIFMVK